MNVIALVVVTLVILIVVGNLSMMRNTPTDNKLMKLRDRAREMGLNPRLIAIPDWAQPNFDKASIDGKKGMIAMYSLIFKGSNFELMRAKVVDQQLRVTEGNALYNTRPFHIKGAIGVEMVGEMVSIYWRELENSDPAHLQCMKDALTSLVAQPNHL